MNTLLESIKALKKLHEEEGEEEVLDFESEAEEEEESEEDAEPVSEVTEEDLEFYRDVLNAWKELWDEEHEEEFPDLSDEELTQFVELIINLEDTPVEEKPEEGEEGLEEDFNSSFPVQYLPMNEVKDYIVNIPAATPAKPPVFFKLGYAKELGPEIAAKFRGGRGSAGNPFVRIVKCTEYSKLYTGAAWLGTNATKAADKLLGTERHTGEKTGFNFQGEENIENRIGVYANGKQALQAYIADGSQQKVKFFISLNDEDLHEASREEVAQYLTGSLADKVLNPAANRPAAGVDAEGNPVFDKPINRFYLDKIYMIGNLGHSIF